MLVIINPNARLVGRSVQVGEIVQHILEAGASPRVALTRHPGHARQLVAEAVAQGVRRIIVAGGDGTVNEVIQELPGTDTELALIPLGTGNILGRFLRLRPGELPEAAHLAVRGTASPVDLGVMNGLYWAGMAGAGLDADIVENLSRPWKEVVGWLAFAAQAVQTILTREPRPMRLTLDERTFRGHMWGVLISNLPEYTYRMEFSRNSRPDDGLLDFVILHHRNHGELLNFGIDTFLWGEPADTNPAATVVQAQYLKIESEQPVKWQIDGEIRGQTPAECTVAPGALRLVRHLPEPDTA